MAHSHFQLTSLKSFFGLSLSVLFDGDLPKNVEKVAKHNGDSDEIHKKHVDQEHFLFHRSGNPAWDVVVLKILIFQQLNFYFVPESKQNSHIRFATGCRQIGMRI